jgi:hypothetical protein
MFCPRCGLRQPEDHRFCASCGVRLPRESVRRRGPKVTRWFRSIPVVSTDAADMLLRVSRYIEEFEIQTAEGSVLVPNHHVRFSIWQGDAAQCAVSLPDDEAEAMADFLAAVVTNGDPNGDRAATAPLD